MEKKSRDRLHEWVPLKQPIKTLLSCTKAVALYNPGLNYLKRAFIGVALSAKLL